MCTLAPFCDNGLDMQSSGRHYSVALSTNDRGTVLLVVGLSDPAGSKGAERAESRGTNPDGELTVSGCDNADVGASWAKLLEL